MDRTPDVHEQEYAVSASILANARVLSVVMAREGGPPSNHGAGDVELRCVKLTSVNTGSPAFAGDDDGGVGER
jgi:hypothetical protein